MINLPHSQRQAPPTPMSWPHSQNIKDSICFQIRYTYNSHGKTNLGKFLSFGELSSSSFGINIVLGHINSVLFTTSMSTHIVACFFLQRYTSFENLKLDSCSWNVNENVIYVQTVTNKHTFRVSVQASNKQSKYCK